MILENTILYFVMPVLSISMLLIFIRVFKGPRLLDRVAALDLLIIVGIGALSTYAILHKDGVYLDISLILALIAFLSTLAFTYYYIRGEKGKGKFDNN